MIFEVFEVFFSALIWHLIAAFRLACRSPHCCFDGDICTTAKAPLATVGWPSGKQRLANRSITLPLCPLRQIADCWILFNSRAMLLGDKPKATLLLRAATLKQQAMITQHSGKAASSRLVWNQHIDYQNWSRHSNFKIEKGLKILIVFFTCFWMISSISKKVHSREFPPFDVLHHIWAFSQVLNLEKHKRPCQIRFTCEEHWELAEINIELYIQNILYYQMHVLLKIEKCSFLTL